MDRRSRFSPDPDIHSFRTRAASQPPRSSGAPDSFLFAAQDGSQLAHRAPHSPVRDRPWPQQRIGRSPVAVAVNRAPQLRSASFSASAHPNESEYWAPGTNFPSTFEEDDEDPLDSWDHAFNGHQPRSWNQTDSRFRSQAPGVRSRSLVASFTNPLPTGLPPPGMSSLSPEWNDNNGPRHSIDQRLLNGFPTRSNGMQSHSLQSTASMPAAIAHRSSQGEISNLSPFVRERGPGRIQQDDFAASFDHWPSYMGSMKEEEPGSGATSRRHSVSVVQPRVRGVGFAAGSPTVVEESSRMNMGLGRSVFSDEELAGDFSLLNLHNGSMQANNGTEFSPPASFPYAVPRFSTTAHSPPGRNGHHTTLKSNSGYPTLDTRAGTSLTPSDGRSPIADGSFAPSTSSGKEQQQRGSMHPPRVSKPQSGSPLPSTQSREPSPTNGGLQSPTTPNQNFSNQSNSAQDSAQGISVDDLPPQARLVLLEFKLGRKEVFYCDAAMEVKAGDKLIVEGDRGKDIGVVINSDVERHWLQRRGGPVDLGLSTSGHHKAKRAYAVAGPQEAQDLSKKEEDEFKALQLCQNKVRQKKLPMQVVDCEFQWDRRKLTFYFIAESRIDFRDLVRELFRLYKTRIWMSCVSGPLAGPSTNVVF